MQASPVFTFANQAGLDMLETTLVALQDIMLDKILDEAGRKILCSEFSKIMQQVIMMHHVLFCNHGLTKSHTSPILKFDLKLYYNILSLLFFQLQGFAYLPAGICTSSMGRPVSYEQAIAWKVLNDEDSNHCLAFMFINWSFV